MRDPSQEVTRMNLHIKRGEFFRGDSKTLSFGHSHPPEKACAHSVCGCTDAVAERPPGEPFQQKQNVLWESTLGIYDIEIVLGNVRGEGITPRKEWPRATLRWQGVGTRAAREGHKDHAYFTWNDAGLQVEITGIHTDDADFDCAFATFKFGNKMDLSHLRQGHMTPDKDGVDLEKLPTNALWVYDSGYGGPEAMRMLPEGDEHDQWWAAREQAITLATQVVPLSLFDSEVADIHASVEALNLKPLLNEMATFFKSITENYKQTALFEAATFCRKVTRST